LIASIGLVAIVTSSVESRSARTGATERIVEIAQTDNRAMEHLDYLVNDIGSRPVNTVAFLEACRWARDEFEEFGLANVHLERCGEIQGDIAAGSERARFRRAYRSLFGESPNRDVIPICNVVGDIPGRELPGEYVICGAHLDSAPQGPGATDNGTGVAAVMEAARMLAAAGAGPRRTIRFVLFGGEEAGLVGAKGYVEDHSDVTPKISAVYNMDRGAGFISGVQATSTLKADLSEIFAAAAALDPRMPFEIEDVEYLPSADPNCCASLVRTEGEGADKRRIVTQPGCGTAGGAGAGCGAQSDGKPGCGAQGCSSLGADAGAPAATVKEVTADGDTLVMQVVIPGAPEGGENADLQEILKNLDVEALMESRQETDLGGGRRKVAVAVGSSDHAPFLAAGIPSFWWKQDARPPISYPAHTSEDTYDKVNAAYLEHSAAVIAVGAFGTANLDHLLSREKLAAPESAHAGGEAAESGGCGSSCGAGATKRTFKI
jgi:hypothetical protein